MGQENENPYGTKLDNNKSGKDHREKRVRIWAYSTTINLPLTESKYSNNHKSPFYVLVLEGIKMGASIHVNGMFLGEIKDQFLRYTFKIPSSILLEKKRTETKQITSSFRRRFLIVTQAWNANMNQPFSTQLTIEITFDPNIETNGRFMACSGGWDWAPYSRGFDSRGLSKVLSFGIVKPIYITKAYSCQIIYVVPQITYMGNYPR